MIDIWDELKSNQRERERENKKVLVGDKWREKHEARIQIQSISNAFWPLLVSNFLPFCIAYILISLELLSISIIIQ